MTESHTLITANHDETCSFLYAIENHSEHSKHSDTVLTSGKTALELYYYFEGQRLEVIAQQITGSGNDYYISAHLIALEFEGGDIVKWGEMCELLPKMLLFHVSFNGADLRVESVTAKLSNVIPLGNFLLAAHSSTVGFSVVDEKLNIIASQVLDSAKGAIVSNKMLVVEDTLYLIQRNNSIDYFDISRPLQPKYLGSLTAKNWQTQGLKRAPITEVFQYKNYMVINYKAGSGGVTLVDITEQQNPKFLEQENWPFPNDADGHFASSCGMQQDYLVCYQSYGIRWMDIEQNRNKLVAKMNLHQLGTIQKAVYDFPFIHVQYFFISKDCGGIATIEISDPYRPKIEKVLQFGQGQHIIDNKEIYHSLQAAFDDPQRVKHLDLSRLQLTDIPDEVFLLAHLESFDLAHNQIKTLTDKISLLANLQTLNLYNNKVLKQLPLSLLEMNQLKEVQLANNQLDDADLILRERHWFID